MLRRSEAESRNETGAEFTPALPGAALERAIESLLFVADRPINVLQLQKVLEAPREAVEAALESLAARGAERGIRLQRKGDECCLVSAPESGPYVERFLGLQSGSRLSGAALEALAVIAYEQPVTRARIEAVRGVNCDHVLATLQARGLIEEVGRLETVGRPILYGTTFEFLRYFGLERPEQLPPIEKREGQSPQTSAG